MHLPLNVRNVKDSGYNDRMIASLAIKDLSQSPEPVDVLFPIVPALRDKLEHSVDH